MRVRTGYCLSDPFHSYAITPNALMRHVAWLCQVTEAVQPPYSPLPHQTTYRHDRKSHVCPLVNGSLTSHPPSLGTEYRSTHTPHTPMQTCTLPMAARSLPSTCWWWTPSTSASGLVRDIGVGGQILRSLEQCNRIQVCCCLGEHLFKQSCCKKVEVWRYFLRCGSRPAWHGCSMYRFALASP